ncbi:MAG: iron-sulfur cluster assembly accessory protein [Armatimonadetes bacterium]|nr:iron-sulfur cluster assembly accessory protein [Armatimonadota bacterium]
MSFPVEIAPEAVAHLQRLYAKVGEGVFLRLGVKGGGCSGFEYVSKFDSNARESDLATEVDGIPVRIDPKSAEFLKGSRLVYTGNLIGGGFKFENPNAARSCGCGTSFTPLPKS